MALDKFGKYVELRVYDKNKAVIFNSVSKPRTDDEIGAPYLDRLRVDFDMRLVPRHGRLKVDVYNLSNDTIASLVEGEDLTMEIWVGLHGKTPALLGHTMYVSNVVSAIKVPNNVTSLFGFTELKRTLLETQMGETGIIPKDTSFENTLYNLVDKASRQAEKFGLKVNMDLVPSKLKARLIRKEQALNGSLESILDELTERHSCKYFLSDDTIKIVCIAQTPLSEESKPLDDAVGQIQLDPSNFRSNPRVSLGSMTLDINLDASIEPTNIINTGSFITAEFTVDPLVLAYAKGVISSAGPSPNMLALYVDHRGSTHTNGWNTVVTAYGPTVGNGAKVSAQHWAKD